MYDEQETRNDSRGLFTFGGLILAGVLVLIGVITLFTAMRNIDTGKVEAEKRIAEATAAAEAQRLQQQTLTDEYLRLKAIEKWDGKLPTTNAGNIPFILQGSR